MSPKNTSLWPEGTGAAAPWQTAQAARTASAAALCSLLQSSRDRTLALVQIYRAALGDALPVPQCSTLNPPLWELGHIAWFQAYWLSRNPERARGQHAPLLLPRLESRLPDADVWYDSSQVAHASRWQLPLPDLQATLHYAQQVLNDTLQLLQQPGLEDDDALYFFRLALFHEDMHSEAWIYMAQTLGIAVPAHLQCTHTGAQAVGNTADFQLNLPATPWQAGWQGPGFAFDNELASHAIELPACELDSGAVRWQRYLPFVEDGGYREPRWWSPAGWQWLQCQGLEAPRYVRPGTGATTWEHCRGGQWQALDPNSPAVHLSYFEAEAWCAWAGRALPTEAQWERAALTHPGFHWGQVWEWTASPFAPYPHFVAHPYRDYSAPWFDGRPVLKGASRATHHRMAHPRYRNFFKPERNDVPTGFRSCKK